MTTNPESDTTSDPPAAIPIEVVGPVAEDSIVVLYTDPSAESLAAQVVTAVSAMVGHDKFLVIEVPAGGVRPAVVVEPDGWLDKVADAVAERLARKASGGVPPLRGLVR